MVKQKTQTDYWNEGVKFANEKNWEAAIEKYKEAIALKPNPALYTNLAACYKNLNDLEKEKEHYLLAVPGLLNKEYTYTSGPANSTAWWLFENNMDLENAEKLAEIAVGIEGKSGASLDTLVQILFKLEKKEDAIKNLAKLYNQYPEHEASAPLFEKYKSDIDAYITDYFNEESKEDRAKKILETYSYPKNELDFILYGGKYNTNNNFYPYSINSTYKELKNSFLGDDDITKRFFQLVFKHKDLYYKSDLVNAITNYKKDEDSYRKAFSILAKSGVNKLSIISAMINTDYNNENNDIFLSILKESVESDSYDEILSEIKSLTQNNQPKIPNFLSRFLLDVDYDNYIDEVIEIMENTYYYYNMSDFFMFIKEDEKLIGLIVNKLKNYNNAKNKFQDDFFDAIKSFLETGVVAEDDTSIFKKVDDSYHYNSIYNYFVRDLSKKSKFYSKILKLSFLLDSRYSFSNMFQNDNKFKESKIDDLVNLGISYAKQLTLFLDKYSDTYAYNKDIWKKYLESLIKKDFDNVLLELGEIEQDKKKLSFLIPLLWEHDNDKFYPYLLKLSALTSKQVKEAIIECLKGYQNGFDDFKAMLNSKKQGERIVGVELLGTLNLPEKVVPILNELLKKEKAEKVKSAVNTYFGSIKANEAKLRKETVLKFGLDDFNTEADTNLDRNMENINKIKWLEFDKLPKLYIKKQNKEISKELTYSLLNSLAQSSDMTFFYEAEKLLTFIKKDEVKEFSKALYDMWKVTKEDAEWVLILLSIYYNDSSVLDELFESLNEQIENKKAKLIKAFTQNILLIGKNEGFRRIARLLSKNYNASIDSVYYDIGNKLNIGSALYDLRMKNFGFNENSNKTISYGPRSFVLTMTRDFKFTVVDDKGKSFKNLPKPSKKDDEAIANKTYEDFKIMKNDLKEYLKGRKSYLEEKMISEAKWDIEDWKMIFLENPVMNNFAKGLIWSVKSKGEDKDSPLLFRIMEDNSFVDIEDEEYTLPSTGIITLIHPIDLSKEELDAWKEQLEDYEIIQPLDQLNRTVFKPTKEQLELTSIEEFVGFMALRISFKAKLMDKYGWSRGPAEDAGCYYSYQKYLPNNIKAELAFMGECYGGYGDRFQEIWMGGLSFYKDNKEIKIKDISKKLLSEVYLEVKALADSGSGYNKDYMDTAW